MRGSFGLPSIVIIAINVKHFLALDTQDTLIVSRQSLISCKN